MSYAFSRVTDQQVAYYELLRNVYDEVSGGFKRRGLSLSLLRQFEAVLLAFANEAVRTYRAKVQLNSVVSPGFYASAQKSLLDQKINQCTAIERLASIELSEDDTHKWLLLSERLIELSRQTLVLPQQAEVLSSSLLQEAKKDSIPHGATGSSGSQPIELIATSSSLEEECKAALNDPERLCTILDEALVNIKGLIHDHRELNTEA